MLLLSGSMVLQGDCTLHAENKSELCFMVKVGSSRSLRRATLWLALAREDGG